MKKILLFSFLVLGAVSSYAQLTCATAEEIFGDGTISVPTITGTFVGNCAGTTNATQNAMWYVYTAAENGEVTVTSDLAQNAGGDTTVSIITTTGNCTGYACYNGADDVSGTNYLTNLTFPVEAGQTYYIVWDDGWEDTAFDFDFSFLAVPCVRPNDQAVFLPRNITTNSATIDWTEAIAAPAEYDVRYGDQNFDPLTAGTTVTVADVTANLSGLTAQGITDWYLRSNCNVTEQSAWVGPFQIYLADVLPYTNNFDTPQFSDGFNGGAGWSLGAATGAAQSGTTYYFSFSSTTAATNANLFSRAISLQAGEIVTLTFFTRLGTATATAQTLKVWANNAPTATGATQLGANITVSGGTYVQQTRTFTAPSAGIYYFIFNNASPIVATASSLRLDTLNITSVLSNNDFLSGKITTYPNPAKNIITIDNSVNALVDLVTLTDLNGRVVKSINVNSTTSTEINVADLAAGVYMMNVNTDQGVAVKKVIKQ